MIQTANKTNQLTNLLSKIPSWAIVVSLTILTACVHVHFFSKRAELSTKVVEKYQLQKEAIKATENNANFVKLKDLDLNLLFANIKPENYSSNTEYKDALVSAIIEINDDMSSALFFYVASFGVLTPSAVDQISKDINLSSLRQYFNDRLMGNFNKISSKELEKN